MTAVFGTLVNNTDKAVTVTTGTCAKSTKVEMHEMVMDAKGVMVMQPIDGGLVVPAKGSKKLEPGANHIMLMGLTAPVVNGETLDLTLTTDGGSVPLSVPIRTFTGGAEPYHSGSSSMSSSSS
jgi:copper(I)-binding protein